MPDGRNLLREPLVYFLLIGAGLFVVYELVQPSPPAEADNRIVVSPGKIEQLATVFAKTWQRPPSREELQGLIDEFVLEEVYYRQARAMGIDRDDTIIRRRLRQKLEFLTDDTAGMVEADDQELQEYLTENADRFRQPTTYTFQQIYFNPDKNRRSDLESSLSAVRAGDQNVGDTSLLPESYQDATRAAVDGTFGTGFSRQLDALETGTWQGPLQSGLGWHLIRVTARKSGTLPDLQSIRSVVEREWMNDRRLEFREQFNQELLKQYDVRIEWPSPSDTNSGSGESQP
jgi:hypothetical protein